MLQYTFTSMLFNFMIHEDDNEEWLSGSTKGSSVDISKFKL